MLQTIKENFTFIIEIVAIFAALVLIALAAQKLLIKDRREIKPARKVAYMGMFAALSGVIMLLEIPLFFAPSFYKLDFSEVPVLICAFAMGPVEGVVCEFLKVVVKLLLKGTTTAFVGDFANFAVGCSFVLPASVIYHTNRTFKRAVISLVAGGLTMTVFGSLFNAVYLIPAFSKLYGAPIEAIIGMAQEVNPRVTSVTGLVVMCVVPFNLLKSLVVSVITLPLYKRVKRLIKI